MGMREQLNCLTLSEGKHHRREDGMCLMEAVAWWADLPHSDLPVSTSPVLTMFGWTWNDGLDDEERNQLRQYVPRLYGTADAEKAEEGRAWLALDWLARVAAPAWLTAAGFDVEAGWLSGLPEVTARTGGGAIRTVQTACRSVGLVTAQRMSPTEKKATLSTVWVGLRRSGVTAAEAAGTTPTNRTSHRLRLGAGGTLACRMAATMLVWSGTDLQPTVSLLQPSAHDLFDRMILHS